MYKFNKDNLSWDEVGQLEIGRFAHSVGVVNKQDVEKYCSFETMDRNSKYVEDDDNVEPAEMGLRNVDVL